MIVFVSNFVSPHVIPLCDELSISTKCTFLFIETRSMSMERRNLGYNQLRNRKYVISYEEYFNNRIKYQKVIDEAEVVLASFCSIDNSILLGRVSSNKLTFLLSERIFKKGVLKLIDPRFWNNLYFLSRIRNKDFHLLCMGAYVANDFSRCGFPIDRMWKFGYITKLEDNNIERKFSDKYNETIKLLWVGRMIWWKRPFHIIKAVEKLKKNGIRFTLDIIGGGELEKKIRYYINQLNIPEITYYGTLTNNKVREMMLASDILVCTSNRLEGWGAVINEGLNAGCLVVANEEMGATPYLIKNGITGYSYRGGFKELFKTLLEIIEKENIKQIAQNGYMYIQESWSASVAAERLLNLISQIQEKSPLTEMSKDGICSKACK